MRVELRNHIHLVVLIHFSAGILRVSKRVVFSISLTPIIGDAVLVAEEALHGVISSRQGR